MTEYQVWHTDPVGTRIRLLKDFLTLECVRTVNGVGALTLALDGKKYHLSDFRADHRLEVERRTGRRWVLEGETKWFIRRPGYELTASGEKIISLGAVDALEQLDRRIVAYAAGTAQASKSDYADDMMKSIVAENLGGSAVGTQRDISAYLDVQANLAAGPALDMGFARRNVLNVLQDIALASYQDGTWLAFDVVWNGSKFEFKTYTGQRGADRGGASSSPVIFAPERGNLYGRLSYDYSNEVTVAYVAGQGTESDRATSTASDSGRMAVSPFNRREDFRDARQLSNISSLAAEAAAALKAGRPKILFDGTISDTPQTRYGQHWLFGDRVQIQFAGLTFDARINKVTVSVDRAGKETISAGVEMV